MPFQVGTVVHGPVAPGCVKPASSSLWMAKIEVMLALRGHTEG